MNVLNDYLNQNFNFYATEVETISTYFKKVDLEKGAFFLKEGQVCKKVAFIEKGALLYYELIDGQEKVCDFAFENDWITQYKSMLNNLPSELNIRTLEPTILHQISLGQMASLMDELPKANVLRSSLAEQYFTESAERATNLANLKAEDRYRKMVEQKPELLQRVPQYYVASYLGIKPQSLSRIRAMQH